LIEDRRDLSTCAPWERSLASSRKRRRLADAARRRRRRSRGSAGSLVALVVATAVVGAGIAVGQSASGGGSQATATYLTTGSSGKAVAAVQRKLGVRATGHFGRYTRQAVRRFQRRQGLLVDGIVGPQTLGALGLAGAGSGRSAGGSTASVGGGGSGGGGSGTLARIASCESGGNPHAVGGGGRYRGKYQFDRGTWRSVGGSGDPAAAPEAEQDRRAAMLLARNGTGPWRNCAG
jgi:transglycosylase-like protein/putative peptidoglycan binding protein